MVDQQFSVDVQLRAVIAVHEKLVALQRAARDGDVACMGYVQVMSALRSVIGWVGDGFEAELSCHLELSLRRG